MKPRGWAPQGWDKASIKGPTGVGPFSSILPPCEDTWTLPFMRNEPSPGSKPAGAQASSLEDSEKSTLVFKYPASGILLQSSTNGLVWDQEDVNVQSIANSAVLQ